MPHFFTYYMQLLTVLDVYWYRVTHSLVFFLNDLLSVNAKAYFKFLCTNCFTKLKIYITFPEFIEMKPWLHSPKLEYTLSIQYKDIFIYAAISIIRKDKTLVRWSYHYNRNSCIINTAPICWNGALGALHLCNRFERGAGKSGPLRRFFDLQVKANSHSGYSIDVHYI